MSSKYCLLKCIDIALMKKLWPQGGQESLYESVVGDITATAHSGERINEHCPSAGNGFLVINFRGRNDSANQVLVRGVLAPNGIVGSLEPSKIGKYSGIIPPYSVVHYITLGGLLGFSQTTGKWAGRPGGIVARGAIRMASAWARLLAQMLPVAAISKSRIF